MVHIQIDVEEELDKQIEIYKAAHYLDTKSEAVIRALSELLKVKYKEAKNDRK